MTIYLLVKVVVSDKIVGASEGLQPPSLGVTKGILQGPEFGKQNVLDPRLSELLSWKAAIKCNQSVVASGMYLTRTKHGIGVVNMG